MKKILFKILKNLYLVFIFLFLGLIINKLNSDEIWNYGFAYNIYKGLIPYKDFNMIITPFFPFLMSLPFHIFGASLFVMHIYNAILLTITFNLTEKIIGKNFIVIILSFLIFISTLYPSYNLFLFFLLVVLIYLEKNNCNDFLIGIVISIAILTKQSVGIFYILPSVFYLKNHSKIIKRLFGLLMPIFIFIIYLIITNSYKQFIDLCILGLYDFNSLNRPSFNMMYFISFFIIIIQLIIIIKNYKRFENYYFLLFSSLNIPLFDCYHTKMVVISTLLMLFYNYDINLKINLYLFFIGVMSGIIPIALLYISNDRYPNNVPGFEYKYLNYYTLLILDNMSSKLYKYRDKKIVFLTQDAYLFKLSNNLEITKLDLINRGNWGYDGNNKLFDEIQKQKDAIFVINEHELGPESQTDSSVINYIIKNGDKIDNVLQIFDFYILDG